MPERGYRGISMLLDEKPRGSDADPFPVAGILLDGGNRIRLRGV